MDNIGMLPVTNVVEDPLPDLTVFAPAISDAVLAYSQALDMQRVTDLKVGNNVREIFDRLRYEIVCLQEVPPPTRSSELRDSTW